MDAPCSSGCTQHPLETPCRECDGEEEGGGEEAAGAAFFETELGAALLEEFPGLNAIEEETPDDVVSSE